jgi:cytochrome c oxidase subunit 2
MMSWLLPESVSTYGPSIDRLYYIILGITGVVFVLTQGALIAFLVRYRHREGRRAAYIHGSTKAEVLWTAGPFLIVIFLALYSRGLWAEIKDPARFPGGSPHARVMAKQFEWNVTYAGPDGELDTADDFIVRNQLHVPVGEPFLLLLESEDVIHSLFIPDLRVKQDALPGKSIPVWFEVTAEGEYPIGCAELCGNAHTRMRGTLVVHSADAYRDFLATGSAQQEED